MSNNPGRPRAAENSLVFVYRMNDPSMHSSAACFFGPKMETCFLGKKNEEMSVAFNFRDCRFCTSHDVAYPG